MENKLKGTVKIGIDGLVIGKGQAIAIQTMCNTHTSDEAKSIEQCIKVYEAGAQLIRLTVPGLQDVEHIKSIREQLHSKGILVPIVADIHFSSATALAVAPFVDKVRINPGNFHKDHSKARSEFSLLIEICKQYSTAIRIGVNHGSLGEYITNLYGNTPKAMALAALEWIEMCREQDFHQIVISLKSSNTVTMVQAYRELVAIFKEKGYEYPLHVGVTEAGNGLSGRIKSCVGIATLLEEGIGDTIRVSLTEAPEAEIPVAAYLAERYSNSGNLAAKCVENDCNHDKQNIFTLSKEDTIALDAACTWGPKLMRGEIEELTEEQVSDKLLREEIMQAARKKFYRAEYIACPGCGRTMYNLQKAFEQVKAKTSHLNNIVIAVMGCIVNGPGEMADADWGYVGEGGGKVSIYKKNVPILKHIPEDEACDKLLELIENDLNKKS